MCQANLLGIDEYTLGDLEGEQGVDEARFLEVTKHYKRRLESRCLGSHGITKMHDAEEITNDVFFELWDKASKEPPLRLKEMAVQRFLFGRLKWRCEDKRRWWKRRRPPSSEEIIEQIEQGELRSDELEPDKESLLAEFLERLKYCLNQLSQRENQMVLMFVEEGTQAKAARRLKVSQKTVSVTKEKAVSKLRICIEEGDVDWEELFRSPSFFELVKAFIGGLNL